MSPVGDREEELREVAFRALEQAYAPYSSFRVGAALLGSDGTVTSGCNVETAAYPSGLCAERAAIVAAVLRGVRRFDAVVIASEAESPAPPCGMCRQMLVEFAPELEVVSITKSGAVARWNMRELLPHPFTPLSLEHR